MPMPSGWFNSGKEAMTQPSRGAGVEGHLRRPVHEYVEHYHWVRNHQGLQNQLLRRPPLA